MNFIFRCNNVFRTVLVTDISCVSYSKASLDLQSLIMNMKKDLTPTRPKPTKQKSKYSAANVTLQVLGSGAKGSPASLYVFSDQSRYLFNCGEGTQRLAHEHKMKLSKLEHVFITHSSWKNFGGLPGMCLTLQDSGVSEVVLHGPPQVDDIFWATKRFVILRDLIVHKADQTKPFEDTVMQVEYVFIESSSPCIEEESESDSESQSDVETTTNQNGKREHEDGVGSKRWCHLLPGRRQSVGYVCRLHARPGTLQLDKCEAQGVPLGPLLGQLKAGKDITLTCGKTVRSCDVTSPDEPGPVFLVVECPDASYLPSLLSNQKLSSHQATSASTEGDIAAVVVHFSPPEVIRLPQYQAWMEAFPPSTAHLVLNEASTCQGTTAVHRIQHKLHLLHPSIFPLLPPSLEASETQLGDTLVKYHLRPRKGIDTSSTLIVTPKEYVEETMCEPGFSKHLEELREALAATSAPPEDLATLASPPITSLLPSETFPRLSFLGTGSCIPNKTRNTSGILLEIERDNLLLLDCGEGTLGQLQRLLGTQTDEALCSLRAIFISHLHADHHIGLVGILQARQRSLERARPGQEHPPLLLLAPKQIMYWLETYSRKFEKISNQFRLVPLLELVEGISEPTEREMLSSEVLAALGLSQVQLVLVKHCPNAFGVALSHSDGWKITYSGDTEPCEELIEIGRSSDLLIHEATMEDGLEEEARKKKHSTTSEAIEVGHAMGAKFTLLTHFSQRYAKIPLFNDKFSASVGIAFDNMRVSLDQLPLLPLLYPALRCMFSKYYDEMEQKTRHHQLRQERRALAASKQ